MNAYSKDLGLRVLAAVDRGIPRKEEVVELFGVSRSTVKTLVDQEAQDRRCEHPRDSRQRPSVKGKTLREWLPKRLEANPDPTLKEHCEAFEEEMGTRVSEATMSRNNIAGLPGGWPLKKSRP